VFNPRFIPCNSALHKLLFSTDGTCEIWGNPERWTSRSSVHFSPCIPPDYRWQSSEKSSSRGTSDSLKRPYSLINASAHYRTQRTCWAVWASACRQHLSCRSLRHCNTSAPSLISRLLRTPTGDEFPSVRSPSRTTKNPINLHTSISTTFPVGLTVRRNCTLCSLVAVCWQTTNRCSLHGKNRCRMMLIHVRYGAPSGF